VTRLGEAPVVESFSRRLAANREQRPGAKLTVSQAHAAAVAVRAAPFFHVRFGSPPPWFVLGVVALVALALRFALLLRAPAFIIGDSENYFLPGYHFARGIGFDLDLRRTPIYPLMIGLTVANVGEDLSALLLVQHALGVATCVLTAWLGLRLYGVWGGLLAGLLTACAGPLLVAEHYIMAEATFIPLLLLAIVVLCHGLTASALWPLFLGGVLVGVASLARPIGLVVAVTLLAALLFQARRPRPMLVRLAPAFLGLALVLLPWMLRNALVHGSFSADGTGGQTLVGRTMRHDRGFAFENPEDPDPARQRAREIMRDGRGGFVSPVRARIMRDLGLTEPEANRLMRDLAVEAIQRQPGYYVVGTLGSFARLAQGPPERVRDHWETRREARNREEWEGQPEIRHLLGPPTPVQERQYRDVELLLTLYQPGQFGPVVPLLALIGLMALLASPHRAAGALIGLTVVGLLLASAALVAPLPRYRYPAEPLFALLAAGGAVTIVGWMGTRLARRRRVEP
jgi:4-amino-4-deoxy-L-arabinose transferase-like glycosyltransferase